MPRKSPFTAEWVGKVSVRFSAKELNNEGLLKSLGESTLKLKKILL